MDVSELEVLSRINTISKRETAADFLRRNSRELFSDFEKRIEILFYAKDYRAQVQAGEIFELSERKIEEVQTQFVQFEDQALQNIWPVILTNINNENHDLQNYNVEQIRNWLQQNSALIQNIEALDLSNIVLNTLPKELKLFSNLRSLRLYNNGLLALPSFIGNLSKLQILDLGANQISVLPSSLAKLTQLQELILGVNKISKLPSFLSRFTELTTLHFGANGLVELPNMEQYTKLQNLYLGGNNFTVLPESLGILPELRMINIAHSNPIKDFPKFLANFNVETVGSISVYTRPN